MATIKLNSLTLNNFRSFKGKASFQFPDRGLVLIQGHNGDTGGSSGSGKSNLAEALAYLFDYSSFPATELQCWHTEDPMSVEGGFTVDGKEVIVRRGNKPVLTVDGAKKAATAASVKSALPQVTGLSSELMKALSYRPQRKPGMFLSMGDTDKKSFLSTVLGLGKFEEVATRETKEVSKGEEKVRIAEALLNSAKLQQVLQPAKPVFKQLDVLEDALKEAQQHLKSIESEFQDTLFTEPQSVQDLRAKIAEVQEQVKKIDLNRKGMQDQIRQKENVLTSAHWEAKAAASKLGELRTSLAKYRVQMEAAVRQRCPTCTQEWLSDESQDYVTDLQRTIDATALAIQESEAAAQRAQELGTVLDAFAIEKERILSSYDTSGLEAVKKAMQGEMERLTRAAYEESMSHNESVRRKAAEAAGQVRNLEKQISDAKVYNATEESSYRSLQKVWENYQKDLLLKEEALAAAKLDLDTHRDYLGMVKGFLAAIFDEILVEIATEANAILAGVPNVQNVTVSFLTESETLSGTVKQAITPVLSVNGNKVSLRSGLSGGQFVAVELAVDIALGEVISRRTGVVPGFIVLDESLDGLDIVSKEGALEVLGRAAQDRLILVVDHASEVKEKFNQVIEIGSAGGCSFVV